jgi:[ribosomal protein S5]-alanine N-acetyltransferase
MGFFLNPQFKIIFKLQYKFYQMLELNFSPFPEIKTERLLLRRLTDADAPEILFLRSDEGVMKYIDREKAKSLDEAVAFIQMVNANIDKNEAIMWAITLQEKPNTLIGNIGFWRIINQHYRSEIGYMLHPNFWNKGIMKEALLAVTAYGFKKMNLHSIEAHINPGNAASGAVLEKTGFIREAYFKEDYFFKGEFIDTAIYSLLAK